jgi:hypothetical protein
MGKAENERSRYGFGFGIWAAQNHFRVVVSVLGLGPGGSSGHWFYVTLVILLTLSQTLCSLNVDFTSEPWDMEG